MEDWSCLNAGDRVPRWGGNDGPDDTSDPDAPRRDDGDSYSGPDGTYEYREYM